MFGPLENLVNMLKLLTWVMAIALHSQQSGFEATDRLIPPGWSGNPWGPRATEARRNGSLPPIPMTAQMRAWDRWGRSNLQSGDIVFRRGDARILFGYFPFSRFLANASGSAFSHTGIVVIEPDGPVVFDTTKQGVRRQPFAVWMLDNVGPFGVKRPRGSARLRIPAAVAFCRDAFRTQIPFDYNLSLDDESLYCVEMTEKAYRAAGLTLSEPIRLGDMERAPEFPICMTMLQAVSVWLLDEPLSLEQRVFFPGNERHGIWSSPDLETVLPPTDSASPTLDAPPRPTAEARRADAAAHR